ncbi:hypothetical protein AA18895_0325 [Acetobacter ghanensis DSM 18895]|nr:hypothetical protein AA18895_0325 [Acetobacter ghanensis DSM 18895]
MNGQQAGTVINNNACGLWAVNGNRHGWGGVQLKALAARASCLCQGYGAVRGGGALQASGLLPRNVNCCGYSFVCHNMQGAQARRADLYPLAGYFMRKGVGGQAQAGGAEQKGKKGTGRKMEHTCVCASMGGRRPYSILMPRSASARAPHKGVM